MSIVGFFAIDRRVWNFACSLGMGHAVSYLVMARGTGPDNVTTSWSINAIEKRTGISRPNAQKYVRTLVDRGLILTAGEASRPRYKIAAADAVQGCEHFNLPSDGELSTPCLIWLPNTLIDGVGQEIPPVELVRKSQSIDAMRILINLYREHQLQWNSGLEWRPGAGLRYLFDRTLITEVGQYRLFGFKRRTEEIGWRSGIGRAHLHGAIDANVKQRGQEFWAALSILTDAGLLTFVPHLVEADTDGAEIIHPLPLYLNADNGEPGERAISEAVATAAAAMLPDWASGDYLRQYEIVVPVPRHSPNATIIGIGRLLYRPQTDATRMWLSQSSAWSETAQKYREIAKAASDYRARSATCNIKEISR